MKKRVKARKGQQKTTLPQNWKFIFLEELAESSNVSQACRASGAEPSYAYKHRRQDPDFRRKWNAALLEGYEHLELETLHRLRFGTGAEDRKFDIANALRLLVAHKETAARERAMRNREDEAEVLASLKTKIARMRQRREAAQKLLSDNVAIIEQDGNGSR